MKGGGGGGGVFVGELPIGVVAGTHSYEGITICFFFYWMRSLEKQMIGGLIKNNKLSFIFSVILIIIIKITWKKISLFILVLIIL